MGAIKCQCPDKFQDFINKFVIVTTTCGGPVAGRLIDVTNEYLEIREESNFSAPLENPRENAVAAGATIIVLCRHVCFVTVPIIA